MGTGLGLSIVKAILKKHEYNFGVYSVVGKGSTFWFEIKDIVPIVVAKKYAGIGASLVARIKNTKTPFS